MTMIKKSKQITLAMTGASGAPYGLALLKKLVEAQYQVFVLVSSAARVVLATEHDLKLPSGPDAMQSKLVEHLGCGEDSIVVCGKEDWFSPVASGSAAPKQMVVCPCSAGTLASISHGMSDNLIERAADVVLKERGQLILMVRETPFSTLHLENMLKLSKMGVTIMPAAPGFYHKPETIQDLVDFMVARVLDHLGVDQTLVQPWGYDQRESK
ncbi:3-polyprenyl-4-hydroxybenzoate carboxy-lyase ubiX [Vibrio ishigakensis]|uniref:Flavin prenyltransferase UbiX n=1 Tax=Vibrio ishigakensis TaxID=1481914 RepID=A0A0B8QAX2_9VIBR|nr:3-polyprenyl-4-hydroxybenzoate carboxy-lyase ubiX [Vibrio ishigakensis]